MGEKLEAFKRSVSDNILYTVGDRMPDGMKTDEWEYISYIPFSYTGATILAAKERDDGILFVILSFSSTCSVYDPYDVTTISYIRVDEEDTVLTYKAKHTQIERMEGNPEVAKHGGFHNWLKEIIRDEFTYAEQLLSNRA